MERIFFEVPLYKKITIHETEDEKLNGLIDFLDFNGLVNGYNPELNENTSYKVRFENRISGRSSIRSYTGIQKCTLTCVRNDFKIIYFFLFKAIDIEHDDDDDYDDDETIYEFQKIGQYPTLADLEIGKYKKYSKVISKNDLSEFNKAIGLVTHGVGVGSFVYLRRIFENLIEKYHQKAKKEKDWDEEKYIQSKGMSEKVSLLKNYLPELVVKYKKLYGIVSKGIHQLKEQECLEYFPVLKDAIILILEKDYLKKEIEETEKNIESNLASIASKLK
ncbi:hypothetical protein [Aurantibacter sp.]|uniref:hypothetical protein n=1 Tax=Aurantibacter sp. TaxID=2807103 RepID=UPI003265BAC2